LIDNKKNFNIALKFIKDNNTIYDFGCGNLGFFDEIKDAKKGLKLIGWDIEPKMKRIAEKKNYDFKEIKNIKNNSVDIITFFEVIEHITYPEFKKIFSDFDKKLKKNGLLIISTPNPNCLENINRFWNNIEHVKPYSKMAINSYLNEKNYSLIKYELFGELINPLKIMRNVLLGFDWKTTQLLIYKKIK
ncbi:MAG: methyltransferase domain-containing protein, partial [Methanobacterium sp.]|nr:methyltransferase domain-containing protein [Methanobacterium sp.]